MSRIVVEGVFALFAAIGAATFVWLVIGIFIRPQDCKGIYAYTVVTVRGGSECLKKVVNSLLWRQDMLPEEREIIICGDISDKVRGELEYAAGNRAKLSVLKCEEIGGYLEGQMAKNSAGDMNEAGSYNVGGDC